MNAAAETPESRAAADERLRGEIRVLGGRLGEVIRRVEGEEAFELVERVRHLARDRRAGDADAERRLRDAIADATPEQLEVVIRAFTLFFDVANLAEDRHRAHVLDQRLSQRHPQPQTESPGEAIARLHAAGQSAEEIQALLDRLRIELVFTAHPTEAKRRTVRGKLRLLRGLLSERDRPDLPARRRETLDRQVDAELHTLWLTDMLRPRRPTVMEEVARALDFRGTLWEVVPDLYDQTRRHLRREYGDDALEVPAFLRFGSWIGGDRDGHPGVTAEITADTFLWLRRTALDAHLKNCRRLRPALSLSAERSPVSAELRGALDDALEKYPEIRERCEPYSANEIYRRWLAVVEWRLEQTVLTRPGQRRPAGAYPAAASLADDLRLVRDSLRAAGAADLADGDLRRWIDQTAAFGFHFAALDVRQESSEYAEVLTGLLRQCGACDDYAALDESGRQELLGRLLDRPPEFDREAADERGREVLDLFALLRDVMRGFGTEAVGAHVVSMTHQPSDVLLPMVLWRWANRDAGSDGPSLPLVPLFETIKDLAEAPETLGAMLGNATYRESLRRQNDTQIVMIGYSDGTKDGGYLAACWALYDAQAKLAAVAHGHGVRLVVFHGRGGSLGRGGGPAARGILSLPAPAVDGAVRITEQGEVLAERYDDPRIALRHLDQVTWATMLVSGMPPEEPPAEWTDAMTAVAESAYVHYRELVEADGFLQYFGEATPIADIETLHIGSRPARRRGERTLSGLRAIPWVFAWTQSRHMLPAWYGIGTACTQLTAGDPDAAERLATMYRSWPFFRATIDNAALALAKSDMAIAAQYADLVTDAAVGRRIGRMVRTEFDRSRQAVLAITKVDELLGEIPWLQRSIRVRNPYVDPLNFIQIELYRRQRDAAKPEDDYLASLRRLTIHGIAGGLRTTG